MTLTLAQQVTQARNELNNLRKTIRGLQAEHRKDVALLKEEIAKTHTATPAQPHPERHPQRPATSSETSLFHSWAPIGHMRSWFHTKNGTPRQGSVSSLTRGVLRLDTSTLNNPHHALQGLQEFSHVWILFVFDKNDESGRGHGKGHRRCKVAPPRLGGQRVGVFGTRSPHRPNPLGLTLARLDKIEGHCLHLSGLDILDGTPVLDIKPYILQYDAPPVVASHFANSQTPPSKLEGVSSSLGDVTSKLDSEENSSAPGHCTKSGNYNSDINQKNQLHDALTPETHTEGRVSGEGEDLESNVAPENKKTRLEQLSELATNTDSERTEEEVNACESLKHGDFTLDSDENSDRKPHIHENKTESINYKEGDEGNEDDGAVVMAPWLASPPTALLQVLFNPIAEQQIQAFSHQAEDEKYRLQYLTCGDELRAAVASVLRQDPRSQYRRSRCTSQLYYFTVDTAHVTAWFEGCCAEVLRVRPLSTQHSASLTSP